MQVHNTHVRRLPADPEEVGRLIDSLSAEDDRLWPLDWGPMRFDRPLDVGAVGGHGPVRYHVVGYAPGRWVRFRFTAPRGFAGFHEFSVQTGGEGAELHHLLSMRARGWAVLTWPLLWRPMHDAALEDALDRAERDLTGTVRRPARWSPWVRALRAALGLPRRSGESAQRPTISGT
ncbi:SRPBCC family protein [Saccharopolyspora taberi]|uniref:SRPBCC family protein n=1 Tax=Saccharopolyspora taberi TaxID=60895 RepID=A0ABN3VMN3_9PSEU